MLIIVKVPPTHGTKKPVSFKIEGELIPDFVLGMLKYMFPKCVKVYDTSVKKHHDMDEESVALESTDWYKKMSAEMTPGKAIRADRGLRGWTQNVLAQNSASPYRTFLRWNTTAARYPRKWPRNCPRFSESRPKRILSSNCSQAFQRPTRFSVEWRDASFYNSGFFLYLRAFKVMP